MTQKIEFDDVETPVQTAPIDFDVEIEECEND